MPKAFTLVLLALIILAPPHSYGKSPAPLMAQADLVGSDGNSMGSVDFQETAKGVKLGIRAHHLAPGLHGIHFHETGSCIGPEFLSAGPHFNPQSKEHGLENPKGMHAGDLPNLIVAADGKVETEIMTTRVTLKRGTTSLLKEGGTSIMIHEKPDDQRTNPTGDSGRRIACGVIKQS